MSIIDSNVIEFPFGGSRREFARKARVARSAGDASTMAPTEVSAGSSSITAQNGRLRKDRGEAWLAAEALTRYWRARLSLESAASMHSLAGTPEGRLLFENRDIEDRWELLGKWRAALVRQLLTPAPDANSVKWKQATFAGGQHSYTDVDPKRIERAIADHLAWLAAHPTRRSIRATKKHDQ